MSRKKQKRPLVDLEDLCLDHVFKKDDHVWIRDQDAWNLPDGSTDVGWECVVLEDQQDDVYVHCIRDKADFLVSKLTIVKASTHMQFPEAPIVLVSLRLPLYELSVARSA